MKDPSNIIAADLSTSERILLFCLASGTLAHDKMFVLQLHATE
jgi:hypothetical protein